MPAGERRAAQALVANYPVMGLKTVAEFSAQAGVSSPTILRFVARLGFGNYAEFQATLQDELAAQLQSPLSARAATGDGSGSALAERRRQYPRDLPAPLGWQIGDMARQFADPARASIWPAAVSPIRLRAIWRRT